MVDNLLLYNGPARDESGTSIVTMNETQDQLRFDISYRDDEGVETKHAIILKALPHRLDYTYVFNDGSISHVPENILHIIGNNIQDSSAHKVYRKAVFRILRRYTKVDSFKTLVEPEQAIAESMYPVFRNIPIYSYSTLKTIKSAGRREYTSSLKQETVQAMAKTLFGQKRYRKDLVKALAGANSIEFLAFMFSLKREIPVDWFINILRNNPTLSSLPDEFSYDRLEKFYNNMSDKQFRKFCRCLMEEDFVPIQSILDTAVQLEECIIDPHNQIDPVTNIKFRTIEEFHYMVNKYHENTAKERERREMIKRHGGPIEGNQWYEQLKNIDFSGAPYEVILPQYAYELVEWGKEMSNCIGSSASRARTSDTDVFVALRDKKSGTMKANILISNRNVRQFYSKRNGQVDSKIAFDFNMRLLLAGFFDRPALLFGNHYEQILRTTGATDIRDLMEDYRGVGTEIDNYINLRNVV